MRKSRNGKTKLRKDRKQSSRTKKISVNRSSGEHRRIKAKPSPVANLPTTPNERRDFYDDIFIKTDSSTDGAGFSFVRLHHLLVVKALIFTDRFFATTGRQCPENRKRSGPARRECQRRNSQ